MRILKIILSIVATLAMVGADAAAVGEVLSPAVTQLVTAGASLAALFGVVPFVLSFETARACFVAQMALGALVTAHVAGKVAGPEWLFHVVGSVGVLAGLAGKAALRAPKPADPAAVPTVVPPSAG